MSTRCSCPDQGDAVVFGECRKCMPNPEQPRSRLTDLPRLLPSWVFVVPETSEGVAADNLQQQLDELERPGLTAAIHEHQRQGLPVPEATADDLRTFGTYDPDLQEARIHQVLGPDEMED